MNRRPPPTSAASEPLPRPAYRYHPFLAIHLLEQRFPGSQPLGACGTDARGERVRLRPNPSLSLPATDLEAVGHALAREGQPARVVAVVNFFGLSGATSPLPLWCAQALLHEVALAEGAAPSVREERIEADTPGCAFLDLINHRLISLRYRAWRRSRPYLAGPDGNEPLLNVLRAAVGASYLPQTVAAQALRFAGALMTRNRSASGLQNMLQLLIQEDDFIPEEPRCRAVVTQLAHARWVELPDATSETTTDVYGAQPTLGRGLRLHRGILLGRRMLDRQSQLGLRLGPVRYERLLRLVRPNSPLRQRLLQWVASYVRQPFSLTLEVKVPHWLVPQAQMPERGTGAPLRLERAHAPHLRRCAGARVMLVGDLPNLEAACRARDDLPGLSFLRCAGEAGALLPLLKQHAMDLVVLSLDALPVWDAVAGTKELRALPALAVAPGEGAAGWQPWDLSESAERIAAALWSQCTSFSVPVPLCPSVSPPSQTEVFPCS